MALKLKTAPTAMPVTLDTAKAHCRVDDTDSDALIATYIAAATSYLDGLGGILGRAMVAQTWELYYDAFPCGSMQIPLGPLIDVVSVEYADPVTGAYQTWAKSGNWTIDAVSDPGWLIPVAAWPTAMATANAVKVTFTAGFGDQAKVPMALQVALLLLVGDLFENRESTILDRTVDQLPYSVRKLIAPFRHSII